MCFTKAYGQDRVFNQNKGISMTCIYKIIVPYEHVTAYRIKSKNQLIESIKFHINGITKILCTPHLSKMDVIYLGQTVVVTKKGKRVNR